MDFSRIARQLNEENPALSVERVSGERALEGGQNQINKTNDRKNRQKAQMATQKSTTTKSDVSYASEEARAERYYERQMKEQSSDWRSELWEEAGMDDDGNHPYVDVMPFMNQKQMEAKKQMKGAAKMTGMEGGKQAKMAMEGKELSIDDQLAISRKSLKPVPKGGYDHKAIRAKQMAKAPKSDTRTQREKETQGRYRGGGRYEGD